jgi:hypothetical protein
MSKIRIVRLAAAAAGAVLVSGLVVAVTAYAAGVQLPQFAAASPSPSPSKHERPQNPAVQADCQAYLNHFAKDLNKSTSDVQKAAKQAFDQTVDDAVAQGKLTKAEGDALKAKFDANQLCTAQVGVIAHGAEMAAGKALGQESISAVASVLGISTDELMSDLRSGKTVKDLAAAKGMDETAFRAAYVAKIKSDLAALVSNKTITQAQADKYVQMAQNGPIPGWNGLQHKEPPKPPATG